MNNRKMTTLSEVMTALQQRGISQELRMNEKKHMVLSNSDKTYQPEDLCILKSYRFEGDSNPDDNAVLYVIEDNSGNKAMLIDSYGADSNYSGQEFDDFLRAIPISQHKDEFLDSLS